MNTTMNRRINDFQQLCQNHLLEDYYGIKNDNGKLTLHPVIVKETKKIELNINFEIFHYYDIIDLPEEISRVISEYLRKNINIRLEILFPNDYPFSKPFYSFINVDYKIPNPPVDIEEYYKYIINNHNEKYNREWSPAISITNDILDFIQKINHFEYILCD